MCLAGLFLKLILYLRLKAIIVCSLYLKLKLNTKQGTANEITHLFIFIKCKLKNLKKKKKTVKLQMRKNEQSR